MIETRKKISAATSGENNPFYGKTHTEQTKNLLRELNTGKKLSEDAKNKISIKRQGHAVSDETRQKIR